MEKCFRCGVSEEESFLYDAFYGFENVKVCDECAKFSGIIVIKTPTSEQLKASEKLYGVRERLSSLSGVKLIDKTSEAIKSVKLSEKIELPEFNKPRSVDLVFKLVDNFHWLIQTTRRRKGYSAKQLAEAIKESQAAVDLLEKGKIPGNSLDLIIKIEQFLGVILVKRKSFENTENNTDFFQKEQNKQKEQKSQTDSFGDLIVDEKKEENLKKLAELAKKDYDKTVDFSTPNLHGITVSDLKRINEQVDKDSPKKSSFETGEEQFEGFGKEDTQKIKDKLSRDQQRKEPKKGTPSIYDLMKLKEEREKKLIGRDIEIIKGNKKESDTPNFDDLE